MTRQRQLYLDLPVYRFQLHKGVDVRSGKYYDVVTAGTPVEPGSAYTLIWRQYVVVPN